MSKGYRLAEIAKWVGGVVRGDASALITGVAGVAEASASELTWIANEKYVSVLRTSRAGAVVDAAPPDQHAQGDHRQHRDGQQRATRDVPVARHQNSALMRTPRTVRS